MQRTLILVLLLSAWGMPTHSASGSISDSFAKTALQSLQAIETDILTTEQAMKAIFDPLNAEAKTEPEKSMTKVLHQVYEQKLIDNRLRKAEFDVLDESLNSSSPIIRDYISREQIAQYDHEDAEMSRHEAACFEPLKMALANRLSENPKACLEWINSGTPTTPFDMVVLNQMSRFHLAIDALKYVPRLRSQTSDVVDVFNRKLYEHHDYIRQHLEDMPEIRNWRRTADFSEPSAPPPLAKGHPRANMFSDS